MVPVTAAFNALIRTLLVLHSLAGGANNRAQNIRYLFCLIDQIVETLLIIHMYELSGPKPSASRTR